MKRISHKKFVNLSPDEIGKMNKEEVINLLQDAREKLSSRLKTFSKEGRYFYSFAEEKIKEYYEENRPIAIEKISRNRALNELFHIQSFFQSQTGTIAGARSVMREQDINIFGENKETGRPNSKLNRDQRSAFWEVYYEFLNDKKNAIEMFTSDRIIQYLGERVIATKGKKLDYKNDGALFTEIYSELNRRKNIAEESHNDLPNVFTGRRNN